MSLAELLRRRRMVRDYSSRPVEPEKLERILDCALRGPSAGNSQGVSLVVVETEARRKKLAELAGEPQWVARGYPPWLSQAPVHVILCAEPEVYRQRYAEPDKARACSEWAVPYWHVDSGCALMLMLLAAVEEGLAAGFQGVHNLPGLAAALDIPPQVEPLGLVTLGYSESQRRGHSSQRARRGGRIHREHW